MKLSIIVKKIVMLIVLGFVMGAVGQSVLAQNLVRFSGGIGDIPTGSTSTTVRGVAAAGQIWVIRDLAADVRQDPMGKWTRTFSKYGYEPFSPLRIDGGC